MRKLAFCCTVFLLLGCQTTQSPGLPSGFNLKEGHAFDKRGFSYQKYAETSYKCFEISKRMKSYKKASQADGYVACMNVRGYELKAMSPDEVEKRRDVESSYIDKRTYSSGKYFDKKRFKDDEFAKDSEVCTQEAMDVGYQGVNVPHYAGTGAAGALVTGFISGVSTAGNKREARNHALLKCMIGKGYLLERLPQEEIARRTQVLKDYASKKAN